MAKQRTYEAEATDGSGAVIQFTASADATPEQLQIIAERLFEIEQKAKKAARQAKREPSVRYVPSQTYSSYGQMGTPLHEVSSYASSTHMGSPGYYSPVHPGSGEEDHSTGY